MKYDHKRKEFYIEIDDLLNNTEFSDADLADKLGERYQDIIKRDLSRMLCRAVYGAYRGKEPKKHRDFINAYVLNNTFAQTKLRDAFIELVKGAMYSGMDLLAYRQQLAGETKHKHVPDTVYEELLMGDLWQTGEKLGVLDYQFPTHDVDLGV